MNDTSDADGGTESSARANGKPVAARSGQYIVAPIDRRATMAAFTQRLNDLGVPDVVRSFEPRGLGLPAIAVVRLPAEKAAALRTAAQRELIIEADRPLRAAGAGTLSPWVASAAVCAPFGPGLSVTIRVLGERQEPIVGAVVGLVGEHGVAEGMTDGEGKATLSLICEAQRATALFVRPRAGYWSRCWNEPDLDPGADNVVVLRQLTQSGAFGWGGRALRFDLLPSEYRGAGVKIALIDSGVAADHPQLSAVTHGLDATRGEERSWSQDGVGHGTPGAGILVARGEAGTQRGYAPDAELHACKLPREPDCSDLVDALDYCVRTGIDVACVGFACDGGSTIVENCLAAAKERGVAIIAAAGSDGGPAQFPACSPHVLAVGAVGQFGVFPDDSLHAALAEAARASRALLPDGLFVPRFANFGPEIDLCAPGVAVVSCQSGGGVAACDGASLAAPHVAALAALMVAHRGDLRRGFAARDGRRVERLFQILKETARPLGDPWRTGAGLPDAAYALGLAQPRQRLAPQHGLADLRDAMRLANLDGDDLAARAPRGAAVVCREPFDAAQPTAGAEPGVDLRVLREVMVLVGLSANI
jgi:subtilisin